MVRITYRTLGKLIDLMSENQKDSDVTVEFYNGNDSKCFVAELRIVNENHDSLDAEHPVIYASSIIPDNIFRSEDIFDNINDLAQDIGLSFDK